LSARKPENRYEEKSPSAIRETLSGKPKQKKSSTSFFLTFTILFIIWLILSGRFDPFHIGLGIVACTIVTLFSGDLLFSSPKIKELALLWPRFILYIPWLLYQVFLANLQVMYLVFHPRMIELLDPKIIEFRSRLKSDWSRVTFANSITLTPGTITVFVSIYGDFHVHAINRHFAESLPGEMETRVARVFGE
jgi:multicomponent Na+:H+ antiporter subunit E